VAQPLDNRVALVSGAGRNIGAAVAKRLGAEGAEVFVTDLDRSRADSVAGQIREAGGRAHSLVFDVTDPKGWTGAIAEVEKRCKRLDVLVNNAGLVVSKSFEDTDLDEWHRIMRVNLDAPFLGVKASLSLMRESAKFTPFGGSIVNMSSVSGIIGTPLLAAYTTSKAGVRYFSKSIAIDFAKKGYRIRVNSVHPGLIETDSSMLLFKERVRSGIAKDVEDAKAGMVANYPLGRMGHVNDVAGGVLYLASDDSAYVTGTELIIDGGLSAQ